MSDLFSIYEDSLNIVLKNINTVMEHMNHLSKEKTESALNDANNNLKEAERILKQMDLEVSSEKNQNTNFLSVKFRNYKSEVDGVKRKFLKMQENYINKKSQEAFLIEGMEDNDIRKSQKRKLIDNEEIWDRHENLEIGKRKATEMEKISFDIMLNLDKQTYQMKNVRDNVIQMNSEVHKSDTLLNRMLKKENRIKLYLTIFVFTLIIATLLFVFFLKFN